MLCIKHVLWVRSCRSRVQREPSWHPYRCLVCCCYPFSPAAPAASSSCSFLPPLAHAIGAKSALPLGWMYCVTTFWNLAWQCFGVHIILQLSGCVVTVILLSVNIVYRVVEPSGVLRSSRLCTQDREPQHERARVVRDETFS